MSPEISSQFFELLFDKLSNSIFTVDCSMVSTNKIKRLDLLVALLSINSIRSCFLKCKSQKEMLEKICFQKTPTKQAIANLFASSGISWHGVKCLCSSLPAFCDVMLKITKYYSDDEVSSFIRHLFTTYLSFCTSTQRLAWTY
jgi:hypothetical protein